LGWFILGEYLQGIEKSGPVFRSHDILEMPPQKLKNLFLVAGEPGQGLDK
jgi:hypothetical protein